jgi:hypothetical protein
MGACGCHICECGNRLVCNPPFPSKPLEFKLPGKHLEGIWQKMDDQANAMQDPSYYQRELDALRERVKFLEQQIEVLQGDKKTPDYSEMLREAGFYIECEHGKMKCSCDKCAVDDGY